MASDFAESLVGAAILRLVGSKQVEPRPTTLSWTEFRTPYTGLGGVMFVAGLGLFANWIVAADTAPVGRAVGSGSPLFVAGLVLMGLAFYAFIAALSDNRWWWLPRKHAVIRAVQQVQNADAVRGVAELALSQAILIGDQLRNLPMLTWEKSQWWQDNIWGSVLNAWGQKESAKFIKIFASNPLANEKENTLAYMDLISPTLESLSERSHLLPINSQATLDEANRRFGNLTGQLMANMQELTQQQNLPLTAPPTPDTSASPPEAAA